ncbi:MAG: PEGA domain protein [Methanosaeta sp. PtaU1.Bin112]|nr:MAG: PEGA domain protein [Methanosaeta sp. PtaU1.Bin112]
MNHAKVGGVCLLLLIIAAALPINVLAQTPSENGNADDGATPDISQSLLSKSTQGEDISTEKLVKRNSGLKPLGSAKTDDASKSSQASGQTETANQPDAQAAAAEQANAAQESSVPAEEAPAPIAETTATPETVNSEATVTPETVNSEATVTPETVTPDAAVTAETITPDAIATPTSSESSLTPVAGDQVISPENLIAETPASNDNSSQNESVITPPETSQNASSNESETASEVESTSESIEDETEYGTDRIWREGDSLDYTWTPQSFSGFFYDLKNDVGTEKLTIRLQSSGRSVDSGDLIYSTSAQDTDFEFGDWGSYQVMGFMADKYFAGYKSNEIFDKDRSLINDGQLRRVLIDTDDESTITTGSVLPLEEDYELRIKQIDLDGNKVYMALAKDGEEIDSKVIAPDSLKSATYQYKVDISGEDTPIVMAHISNVFASTESALVTVDGLFQISDTYAAVEDGDKYDKMKVVSVSDEGVEMENENSITLRKGSTVKIFGNVGFLVADADEVRFAPVVERTGSYDVRGTVINPSETKDFTWTPYNFEGFYYDIDDDVGTESLQAKISGSTKIEEKDLIYETSPQPVKFEFESWGKYDVIGFMADKFFAGYNNETKFTDEESVINEGQLRRVLIDNDDSQTIASGSVLSLDEDYELRIKQVDLNGNKVYLALAQDGKEVDSKVVTPSSDPTDRASNYLYKVDMGSLKDVPIIAAHIQSVFRSTESDLATVDAVFQISENPESVEEGEIHGKMKVESLSDEGITMRNDGSISLSRGREIEIMDNLKIEVADSSNRLLAPIATKVGEGGEMTISLPDAIVDQTVSISSRSGTSALSGVQILLNGSSIATTDATGSASYTPTSVGTFQIVGKKKGYNDAKASLVVRTAAEAAKVSAFEKANATLTNQLIINAPAEVIKGENFLITVLEGINQTPVDAASLLLDDENIGQTAPQGTMAYSAAVIGEHTLKAEKEGYNSATRKINVASALRIVNLTVPEKANAGSEIKISAIVENVASKDDTRLLELLANGTAIASKNATVKAGENTTISFSYKPKDQGMTRISLDDQSKTVNVEKAQSNWLIVALILVLLIAIGGGYYLYSKGELDGLQRQIKKMMQGR